MKNNDPPTTDDAAPRCRFCGRVIPDGFWFARLWRNGGRLEFCRPRCVELFLEASDREAGGVNARSDGIETSFAARS
jgi:hypothetical protein